MQKTICFACRKGGVAKSTTATTTAAALAKEGNSVVLVDADPQANSTAVMLAVPPKHTVTEVLAGKITPLQAVESSPFGSILPSGETLRESSITSPEQLKRVVDALHKQYDYVIIDSPPSLGKLTVAAMIACDVVIVCTTPQPMGYDASIATLQTVETVRNTKNHKLKTGGILPTMITRSTLSRAYLESLQTVADGHNTICFDPIRLSVSIQESQLLHEPIFSYAPKSNPAQDYARFYNQLKERLNV